MQLPIQLIQDHWHQRTIRSLFRWYFWDYNSWWSQPWTWRV